MELGKPRYRIYWLGDETHSLRLLEWVAWLQAWYHTSSTDHWYIYDPNTNKFKPM